MGIVAGFGPTVSPVYGRHGDLTFRKEPFAPVRRELERLMWRHWEEVRAPDSPRLAPDWDQFYRLDGAGALALLTARTVAGELVGYVLHVVWPSLHYRDTWQASDDAHYLRVDHRKGWAAIAMLRAAEHMLDDLGKRRLQVIYHTKVSVDRGRVFERLGYRELERRYFKTLETPRGSVPDAGR